MPMSIPTSKTASARKVCAIPDIGTKACGKGLYKPAAHPNREVRWYCRDATLRLWQEVYMHAPVSKELKADPLYVLCPITNSPIWTHIATDVRSLTKTWRSKIVVACPHCKRTHKYKVREAFAEAVMSSACIRGEFFAS